jgi:DNA ligase 1
MIQNITFLSLCSLAQKIRDCTDQDEKIHSITQYLKQCRNLIDLKISVRYLAGGACDSVSEMNVSIGSYTISAAAAEFCEIDYEFVFKPCRNAVGDTSEVIEKLMENIDEARAKRIPKTITLTEVETILNELNQVKKRVDKQQILFRAWKKMSPVEVRCFTQLLLKRSLIGPEETEMILAAIANAGGHDYDKIRFTCMITGSVSLTAVLAATNSLSDAVFQMFHPKPFMPAASIEIQDPFSPEQYVAEEKLDGLRCQVHVEADCIRLFNQKHDDITTSFPDVVNDFKSKQLPKTVLDGILCIYDNQTIRPSQLLQKRVSVKYPDTGLIRKYPALFISFDLLFTGERMLFDEKFITRRELLEDLAGKYNLPVTDQITFSGREELRSQLKLAISRGSHGLILKKMESLYDYENRQNAWLALRGPSNSLKAVIMYAHKENPNNLNNFSGYTLGISVRNESHFPEDYIPIGKTGIIQPEIRQKFLHTKINQLKVDRYGSTVGLAPKLLAETEFEDIRINKRTKAGYQLHGPRIIRITEVDNPDEIATLADIQRILQEKFILHSKAQSRNFTSA